VTIEVPEEGIRQRRPRLGEGLAPRRLGPVDPDVLPLAVREQLASERSSAEQRQANFDERAGRYLKRVTAACAVSYALGALFLLPFGLYVSVPLGLLCALFSAALGGLAGWRLVVDGGGRPRGALYAGASMFVSILFLLLVGGVREHVVVAAPFLFGLEVMSIVVGVLSGLFIHWRKFDQQI